MDFVGRKIGRYEIVEQIGEGGMALVYKAFDPEINRSVALKILKEEHCQNEEYKNRFIKEGRAAGALQHPNIVTIYDVGSIDNAPYIMMELLTGKTLGDLLSEGDRPNLEETLQCAIQLADALDYAHSRGIVHRDIKPDNIILNRENNVIKVADFGIARLSQNEVNEGTQAGMMLGTPRYMSPEQATGDAIDGRSDLFATGVILYEMITGQKAFGAESMTTLILQIVQKDPVPIRQTVSGVPLGIEKIVSKLLQKKPDKRFQSGTQLKAALRRELTALRESKEEQSNYLPLQIKWTAIMAAIVAIAMAGSSYFILQAQRTTLTGQLIDSGISLTKFISVQAAIPVLGEDWISLEALVLDASARDTFSYLVVSDHANVVRSASIPDIVGEPRQPVNDAEVVYSHDDSLGSDNEIVYSQNDIQVTDIGGSIYNFSVPVLFNQTQVGFVDVGLGIDSVEDALYTTSRMLMILAVAMVLTVSTVIFLFNKLTARNLLTATRALKLFAKNHHEARISKVRSDEFGDLFNAFNSMADAMEARLNADPRSEAASTPVIDEASVDADVSGITRTIVSDRTVLKQRDD